MFLRFRRCIRLEILFAKPTAVKFKYNQVQIFQLQEFPSILNLREIQTSAVNYSNKFTYIPSEMICAALKLCHSLQNSIFQSAALIQTKGIPHLGLHSRFKPGGNLAGNQSEERRSSPLYRVMKNVPTPVVVICVSSEIKQIRGITCSSFICVSLVPPIISFSLNSPSRTTPALITTGLFSVNILSEKGVELARHFATNEKQNDFTSCNYHMTDSNVPLITDGVFANFICGLEAYVEVGDHQTYFGRVISTPEFKRSNTSPLLFYGSKFYNLGYNIS